MRIVPSKSVWTFSECYTLADVGAECVTKVYSEFLEAVQAQVHSLGGSAALDAQLEKFTEDISLQTGEVVLKGDGFGYLHKALGGKTPKQLAFFENASVEPWLMLLRGEEPKERLSFAYGVEMENLLQKRKDICNWNIPYQLALLSYDRRDFESAKRYCEESMLYDNNAYNSHLYVFVLYQLDDTRCSYFAKRCVEMQKDSYCLAESVLSLLLKAQAYAAVIDCFYKLAEPLQRTPRLLMYLSMAYLQSGNAKQAEDVLLRDGGLVVLDFREGDKLLQMLYCGIRKALYNEDESEVKVPEQFDFIVVNSK